MSDIACVCVCNVGYLCVHRPYVYVCEVCAYVSVLCVRVYIVWKCVWAYVCVWVVKSYSNLISHEYFLSKCFGAIGVFFFSSVKLAQEKNQSTVASLFGFYSSMFTSKRRSIWSSKQIVDLPMRSTLWEMLRWLQQRLRSHNYIRPSRFFSAKQ